MRNAHGISFIAVLAVTLSFALVARGQVTWIGGSFTRSMTAIDGTGDHSSSDQGGPGLLNFNSGDSFSDANIFVATSISGTLTGNSFQLQESVSRGAHNVGGQTGGSVSEHYDFSISSPTAVSVTASSSFDLASNLVMEMYPTTGGVESGAPLFIYPQSQGASLNYSATLPAGSYELFSSASIGASGTNAGLSATLNVVPEPSLLALLLVPSLALRRRCLH